MTANQDPLEEALAALRHDEGCSREFGGAYRCRCGLDERVAAARSELSRLRDAELMLRFLALPRVHAIARGPDGEWIVASGDACFVLKDDGAGLPLLDAAAREAMEKEIKRA